MLALVSAACSPAPSASPSSVSTTPSAVPTSITAASPTLPTTPPSSLLPATLPPDQSVPWAPTTPHGEQAAVSCSGDIGANDPVAVVTLADERGGYGKTVLRNYADVANPTTVCEGVGWWTRLLDARHLWTWACDEGDGGDEADCAFAVVDVPEVAYRWYQMPANSEGATISAIAADVQTIAMRRYDDKGGRELHVADDTGDHIVYRFPTPDGRCGSPIDSNLAAFSRSGDYLYVLDQAIPERFTLVVVGGHEVRFTVEPPNDGWPDGEYPLMAVWSPVKDTLYYRKGSNVFEWTPSGGRRRTLQGVPWLYPTITPDGRHLVYALEKADGYHDLYLATMPDLGNATRIARNRTDPVFLNNSQLWYRAEGGGCGANQNPRSLIYNIRSREEFGSVLVNVQSIWPGTSSNH
jgi:hypothetical protein